MTNAEAGLLKKGDRVYWSNPNPGADPASGGVVKDVVRSQVQIVWDDGAGCVLSTNEGRDFWPFVRLEKS